MHENQGDVLLPLSTLKRTVCSAVPTVADVVRLRGTAVKLSGEGGQATNNLPMAGILSLPICVRRFRLTWMFHTKHFENCMETLVYGRINQIREYER